MKIQDFIRLKSKERIFNILIQFTDQYTENKEGYFKQVGITSKGILKHFYKVIQPTTYFVHLLGESLNKIQYIKILELYKLDPKDFVDQDPDSLYSESHKKGLLKASKQIAQERIDKLKLDKHNKQDILSEKHKKMLEMQQKKIKEKEKKIEDRLHEIGEKVLSHDRVIKSEGLNDLIIVAAKESKYLINIKAFQILVDEAITDLVKSHGKLSYNDAGKILEFLADLVSSATFFFNDRSDKLCSAGVLNLAVSNSKLKSIAQMYLASLSKYGQVNIFIPELINQYNSITVSAINEKVFLLE